MKIKTVCELTGLSDRTIRYYIEEDLISPSYTENYMGRRTYNFSEKDIKELNDIAVLRKFDFTIEEIRTIINDIEASRTILLEVKNRTEKTAENCQEKLKALSLIPADRTYSVAELAEELSKTTSALPTHGEISTFPIGKRVISIIKGIFYSAIVWMPIALSLYVVIVRIRDYHYPVFNPVMIAATVVSILPSIVLLVISKIKLPAKRIIRCILLVLCVFSIPISSILSFGIVSKSETNDFQEYRDFDANCPANRNVVFQALFPNWPHYYENVKQADGSYKTVYLDANYYYNYHQDFDYTYDIYAQWPLHETEYMEEINRVTDLFHDAATNEIYHYKYTEVQTGNYYCLILYCGDEPFTVATGNYNYMIFAYNEEYKIVRYIYCDSLENGADQPYYLFLDWQ